MGLREDLERLRPQMAAAAQKVIDEWQPDEEGFDEVFGTGGACDEVARVLMDVISSGTDADVAPGAPPGHDHEWVVATDGKDAFVVDIPYSIYEEGGGYRWSKVEGASISPHDIMIEPMNPKDAKAIVSEGSAGGAVMSDPRKQRHVFETDVKNRLRSAREAVGDAVSLLEEAGADSASAREKVLSSLGRPEFEEDRLEALADALDLLGAWKGSVSVRAMAEGSLEKTAKLSWPFPPSMVLKDLHQFINYAMGVGGGGGEFRGRKGEVRAARVYLWQLLKVSAPALSEAIQLEWQKASATGNGAELQRLRRWWTALGSVLKLLRRMVRLVNGYEKSPGYTDMPGFVPGMIKGKAPPDTPVPQEKKPPVRTEI